MNDQTLGQRIAAGRKMLGLSQEALGEKMGVSRQAISKWESDGAVPELEKLIAMSRLFGMTLGQLLGIEEASQPAGLSEEQIRSILSQCRTPRPQRGPQILCALLCGLSLVISGMALIRQPGTSPDYSAQIASLQQSNQALQNELGDLRYQLQASQEEDAASLLLDHAIRFGGIQADGTARIHFTATPKTWTPGQTAVLGILRNGQPVSETPCGMDGGVCTAAVDLSLADGYEYRFVLTDEDGSQQFQLLDGDICCDLESGSGIQLEYSAASTASYRRGTVEIDGIYAAFIMPSLDMKANDEAPLRWTDASYALSVNGQEVERCSLFEEGILDDTLRGEYTLNFDILSCRFDGIDLHSGDTVTLAVEASLSSGVSRRVTIGIWKYVNARLVRP